MRQMVTHIIKMEYKEYKYMETYLIEERSN